MLEFAENPLVLLVLVFLLGGLGSVIRYAASKAVPAGLVFVNMAGSLLLGFFTAWSSIDLDSGVGLVLATGFCGSLTTFSTVMVHWAQYADQRQWGQLIRTLRLHLFSGLISAAGGLYLGSLLG